jgi:hypothetical protein
MEFHELIQRAMQIREQSVKDTAFPTISIIMPDMQVRAGIIKCFITAFYEISDAK